MNSKELELTQEQLTLVELGIVPILCVAPAGCGKTEALAHRIAHFISTGEIQLPRRALALTFTNRARENLDQRLRNTLGLDWNSRVDVANFHGFSTRIIQGHGSLLGLPTDVLFPDKVWYERAIKTAGVTARDKFAFERILRNAKLNGSTDSEVLERISESNDSRALLFEEQLREEHRIDFNDLMRYGLQLLRVPIVSQHYSQLYPLVVVDEVQDLTLDQYELVRLVGEGRTTYAGDREQGIYAFAGARPEEIFQSIEREASITLRLSISQRSSPEVLAAVNAISPPNAQLTSAEPTSFNGRGFVALLESVTWELEADQVIDHIRKNIADNDSIITVGIISRRSSRLSEIRRLLVSDPIMHFEDWTTPTHNGQVIELLYKNVDEANTKDAIDENEVLDALRTLCLSDCNFDDIELRGEIEAAFDDIGASVGAGNTVRQSVDSCRRSEPGLGPVRPGIHLLNAHIGKGQEFDLVIIVGLENGVIPDFRAVSPDEIEEERRVLHVMLTRARTGVSLTWSKTSPTRVGLWSNEESPWLPALRQNVTKNW